MVTFVGVKSFRTKRVMSEGGQRIYSIGQPVPICGTMQDIVSVSTLPKSDWNKHKLPSAVRYQGTIHRIGMCAVRRF